MLKSTILRQSKEQMPISLVSRKSHFERIEFFHVKVKKKTKNKNMEALKRRIRAPEYRGSLVICQNIIHHPIIY